MDESTSLGFVLRSIALLDICFALSAELPIVPERGDGGR
jgi:hypothetical protein